VTFAAVCGYDWIAMKLKYAGKIIVDFSDIIWLVIVVKTLTNEKCSEEKSFAGSYIYIGRGLLGRLSLHSISIA